MNLSLISDAAFPFFKSPPKSGPELRKPHIGQIMRIGILTITLMIAGAQQILLATPVKAQPIDKVEIKIGLNNETLVQAFQKIEAQSPFHFMYRNDEVKDIRHLTISPERKTVEEFLKLVLAGTTLTYQQVNNQILILQARPSRQDIAVIDPATMHPTAINVKGKVTNLKGLPLEGVSVTVKEGGAGTSTDGGGNFSIMAEENSVLVFSSVGYTTQEVPVGGRSLVSVSMIPTNMSMDQVVVIGYGTQKKSEITGAIATVSGKEIANVTTGSLQQALQGRVAGLNITPTTGQPGGAMDMSIRGVATFGNANPLFVIDGVPVLGDGTSRNFNPLASLPLENIESVQILKDASAAAIYGARAANGVIIVTTNRGGHSGQNHVEVKATGGFSQVSKLIPMMNSAQYIDYATEAYTNGGAAIPVSLQEPLRSKNLMTNTDWQRSGFHTGAIQNYYVGLNGGNDHSNYAVSGGYLDQQGNLPNSDFKRYSVNINSDFVLGKRKNWRVGETIGLAQSIWSGTFSPTSLNMRQLLQQSPTVPVYKADDDGGFDGPRLEYSPVGRQNTIGMLTLIEQVRKENRLIGDAYINWEIIPGLSDRFSASADMTTGRELNFVPTYDMGQYVNTLAQLTETRDDRNIYYLSNTLTYQHTFGRFHKLTALAGFTQQQSWSTGTTVVVRTFQSNDLRTVAAGFEQRSITGNETGWALQSEMARVSYSFKDKYNIMGVVRRDGSSRFGSNNRYGVFPSISGNWIISKEKFMEDRGAISDLKLRASYGKVGSQDIDDFAQYATIQPNVNYVFGSAETLTPGATFVNMGNSNLRWEVTTQTDIGLDLSMFQRKLSFILDYYVKNTDGILIKLPIPTTSGIRRTNGPFVNAGSVRNQGFEFTATYQNSSSKNFSYSLSANIATNQNRVISLNSNQPIIAQLTSGTEQSYSITQQGGQISEFYGYIMEGIFKDQADVDKHAKQAGSGPGDVKFKDINGDGVVNGSDQTIIGSPFPKFTYGFNASLRYKNFDLDLFLTGKQGQYLYNLVWATVNEGNGDNNATTDQLRRWTPSNTNTDMPRAIYGNPGQNTRPSTRYVENASYLRIQNVQLGYNLPAAALNRLKLSRLRIYIASENLYTFTKYRGYNPEIGKLSEGSQSSLTRGIDFAMIPIPRIFEGGFIVDF
ncbi:MAG TPA: TonB-dependent receptor [Puia sp.]|nr:TonB-dependent receptor [Puia sp.]